MTIEQINGYSATTTQKSLSSENTLGKDEFLNLLVTQLQYQDPLNPMDNTEFTAQLAQFSSLEQLSNLNDKFDTLTQSQTALNNTQAVSYIGQTVLADGSGIQFDGTTPVDCIFELEGAAAGSEINIYDGSGQFVRTLDAGALDSGQQAVSWDGRDQEGNLQPAGQYDFEVLAVDAEDGAVAVTTLTRGTVTGVTFRSGNAYLTAAGKDIAIHDIRQVTGSGV